MATYAVLEYLPPNLLTLDVKPDLPSACEMIRAELAQNADDQITSNAPPRFFAISVSQGE